MQAPNIKTAIPKRRYQYGEFSAVVLGELETTDDVEYRFILAMVRPGENTPGFYVTCEKNRGPDAVQGSHRLRVISEAFSEALDSSDSWRDIDAFTDQALAVASQLLGLADEQPQRLM